MREKVFRFTGKDLTKLSIMLIIATLLFGLPGLIIVLFLQWVTNQSYAIESVDKHGISRIGASRMGGAIVFITSLFLFVFGSYFDFFESNPLSTAPVIAWLSVCVCAGVGLIDDLKSNLLSPKVRLASIFFTFGACMFLVPSLIPQNLGIFFFDFLLSTPILGLFITVIFCTGFVNAVNMADGANGLMPGTITIAFAVFYIETGSPVYAIFLTTCGLFTLFNVISGRLFLGDAGAYGLGAMIVLNSLYLHAEEVFSTAFLAVLFAYPCLDIFVTVIRRKLDGRSVFLPDNDHLHNRVHYHFQKWFKSKTLANSLTGAIIVTLSSGLALVGFIQEWWPATSAQWFLIFLGQILIYLITFTLAGINRSHSQHLSA